MRKKRTYRTKTIRRLKGGDQSCKLLHTSKYLVRNCERDIINVSQGARLAESSDNASDDYVATCMSGGDACNSLPVRERIKCKQELRAAEAKAKQEEAAQKAAELAANPAPTQNYKRFIPTQSSNESVESYTPTRHSIYQVQGEKIIPYEYELQSILGKGGQGEVYKGIFPTLGIIAIKSFYQSNIKTLLKEMELTMRAYELCGPHTLRVYGMIVPESVYQVLQTQYGRASLTSYPFPDTFFYGSNTTDKTFILYEYIEGTSLWKLLGMGSHNIANLFYDTVSAIACLHRAGIAHNDIKPDNIMMVNGTIKVIDFGTACDNLTECTNYGTPIYKGPNMYNTSANRSKMDFYFKLDIYALGMTLYVILTYPDMYLPAETLRKWMDTNLEHTVRLPEHYKEWTPILEGMLRRNPNQRSSLEDVMNKISSLPDFMQKNNRVTRTNTESTITLSNFTGLNNMSNRGSVVSNYTGIDSNSEY